MHTYFVLFAAGLLGIVFSNIRKFIGLRRKGNEIDYKVTLYYYLKRDWDVITSQFITVIAALLVWKAFSEQSWAKYAELIFIIIGGAGSEILSTLMSKTEMDVIKRIKAYGTESPPDERSPEILSTGPGGSTNPNGQPPKP
jgi:hypothetical protein